MLRVLVFSHEFPPSGGGAGVVASQICEELTKKGCNVSLLTRSVQRESIPPDVKIIKPRVVKNSFWPLSFLGKVNHYDYDLIILNDPGAIYVAGLSFSVEALMKCVCFLHGSEPENIVEKPSFFKRVSFFKFFYKRALRGCLFIASPSIYMKEKFSRVKEFDSFSEKIEVIYYGVDENLFFYDTSKDIKRELALGDSFVFLTVSRIEEGKGFDKKFEIFLKALKEKSNLKWLIVGQGKYFERFHEKVMKSEASKSIIFVGKVSRESLRFYYSAADVFWLLSEFDESFGLVYTEAQLCDLPCIGYKRAGVSEAISEQEGGILVESADELMSDLNNILKLKKRKIRSRNLALSFSVRSCVNRLFDRFYSRTRAS